MNEELITLTLQEEDSLSLTTDEYIKGDKGDAATVTVGKTTTGEPGTDASVVNSGDEHAAILDFTIPRGEVGRTATVAVGNVSQGAERRYPLLQTQVRLMTQCLILLFQRETRANEARLPLAQLRQALLTPLL